MNEQRNQGAIGQMCWLRPFGKDALTLHLRMASGQPWKPYTAFACAVPDYPIPGGSKGWATSQTLRQMGWLLISTQEASKQPHQAIEPTDFEAIANDIAAIYKAA